MHDSSKRHKLNSVHQGDLFAGMSPLRTQVITRRKEFDELFNGFKKMRAVSYVISPDLLFEFYDKLGYVELEIIVGENLSETYRRNLEQKGIEVVERLEELVEKGALRIFIPTHTIHTKLYILERADIVREINHVKTSQRLELPMRI